MSHLELTRPRPDVAVITLNRPDQVYALNFYLVEELHQTLEDIGSDDGCRVVVLTGAGGGSAPVSTSPTHSPTRQLAGWSSRARARAGRRARRST
jgi:1,4-dihydroxy-2-naphthoyl-CoA synthase